MKVLVTGGTGFVGPKIVHALRAAGKDVRALVRRPERAGQLEAWGCELVQGDMTDSASLRSAAEGCDAIVHLVAIINGRQTDFERIMEQGTRDLIAAAQEGGVRRLVLMSALGTEHDTKDLVPYYHAKWEMEQAAKASGLDHVIFRPSFIFGRDGGALQIFLRQVRWSPVTPIVGPGTSRLQPIWVEDVAAYFERAVELPEVVNRTFELGGPDVVTWNEFYERIRRTLGKKRASVHLPFGLVRVGAVVVERLPGAPITRDQLKMLEYGDNVVSSNEAVETFDLPLVPLDDQLRRAA
jgi:uncharacterized protein YbjT (DUF2867 family)